MKSCKLPSRNFRSILVFAFLLVSVTTGCGKLSQLYARIHTERVTYHAVTISWNPAKSNIAGYNVYRDWQYNGATRLNPQIVQGTQFVDNTAIAGHIYSYYVTSVDSKGLESKPSEIASVVVPN
jgi:fibronectin type 3 domain-containing protein